jgi:hypothetical protein
MTQKSLPVKIRSVEHLPPELQVLLDDAVKSCVDFVRSADKSKKAIETFVQECEKHGITAKQARQIIVSNLRANGLKDRSIRFYLPSSLKNKKMARTKQPEFAAIICRKLEQFRKKKESLDKDAYVILELLEKAVMGLRSFFTNDELEILKKHRHEVEKIISHREEYKRKLRTLVIDAFVGRNSNVQLVELLSETPEQRSKRIRFYKSDEVNDVFALDWDSYMFSVFSEIR